MTRRIYVYHSGCDTGCCGHRLDVEIDGRYSRSEFTRDHPDPGQDEVAWARQVVEEIYGSDHVADLAWDEILVSTE